VLLANLIHIIRTSFCLALKNVEFEAVCLTPMLQRISKFDIQNTLPGLQHNFCALWNEIVLEAPKTDQYDSDYAWHILRPIRHFYIALHQGTDCAPTAFDASTRDGDPILGDPTLYPFCNIPGHQSHINDAAPTAENSHPPIPPPPTVLPPDTVLNTINPY
jgi:hypothetical protein